MTNFMVKTLQILPTAKRLPVAAAVDSRQFDCLLARLFAVLVFLGTACRIDAAVWGDSGSAKVPREISLGLGLLVVAGVLAVTAVVALVLWMRFTHRVWRLLERIEKLQTKDEPLIFEPGPRTLAGRIDPEFRPNATADVLAGRTEEINSIVKAGGVAENLIEQTILATHNSLNQNLSPRELAGELNVSLRTLQRNLAIELNCTPYELILSLKMREAYLLLRTGKYNVTEVAMRLGFSSSSHFSRRFKTFYKRSPIDVLHSARGMGSQEKRKN